MSTPKLVYFQFYSRAESIRMLCSKANIDYTNEAIDFGEWGSRKESGVYPKGYQMPIWITEDGTPLNQSSAIFRYVARQANLTPEGHQAAYLLDWACETVGDFMAKHPYFLFIGEGMGHPPNDEMRDTVINAFKSLCTQIDKVCQENGGKFVNGNDSVSAADIMLFSVFASYPFNKKDDVKPEYTSAFREALKEFDGTAVGNWANAMKTEFESYLQTRDQYAC